MGTDTKSRSVKTTTTLPFSATSIISQKRKLKKPEKRSQSPAMSEQASSPKADRPTRPKPTPEEIKAKKDHKMAINKTFNKQVNTRDRRFTPLRGVNKYKSTIRKESSHVEEIHQLPPYVKNQNLAGKIKAK